MHKGCYVARYQVRQKNYCYYKLQTTDAIFEQLANHQKKSKYKHLAQASNIKYITMINNIYFATKINILHPITSN